MRSLFSLDSPVMQALSRLYDLMLLNVLFLITCIPIVTIGAASAALYTVCFRLGTYREDGIFKPYFRAFRDNFKQATGLWLILLLWGSASGVNALLFYQQTGVLRWAVVLFVGLFVLALMIAAYTFPLLSRFRNGSRATVKNALLLSVGYLPRSLVMVVLNVLPFGLLVFHLYLFLQLSLLWLAIYFVAAAYLNCLLLRKVFAPYIQETP